MTTFKDLSRSHYDLMQKIRELKIYLNYYIHLQPMNKTIGDLKQQLLELITHERYYMDIREDAVFPRFMVSLTEIATTLQGQERQQQIQRDEETKDEVGEGNEEKDQDDDDNDNAESNAMGNASYTASSI